MSPAKDLSILIIIPKNQLLVSLTFFIIGVFWGVEGTLFYFHSENYFLPSADFGFCLFVFLSLVVLVGILGRRFFLRKTCFTMKFPLRTAFAASHRFFKVFSLSFVLRYIFLFLLWLHPWPTGIPVKYFLVSKYSFFSFFLPVVDFILLWSESMLEANSILSYLLRLILNIVCSLF